MPTPRTSTSSSKAPSVRAPSVKAPSRTPTPKGPVNVPMGAVAWAGKNTDDYEMVEKDGTKTHKGKGKRGLFTGGMAPCFTVIILGSSGAIMSHVTAYLAEAKKHKKEDELKTLKAGVEKMWNHAKFTSESVRVVVIRGPNTAPEAARKKLTNEIFPQIADHPTTKVFSCETSPLVPTVEHRTAEVRMTATGTMEVFAEGQRVF